MLPALTAVRSHKLLLLDGAFDEVNDGENVNFLFALAQVFLHQCFVYKRMINGSHSLFIHSVMTVSDQSQ